MIILMVMGVLVMTIQMQEVHVTKALTQTLILMGPEIEIEYNFVLYWMTRVLGYKQEWILCVCVCPHP